MTLLFKKPAIESKEYLTKLHKEIFKATKDLEELRSQFTEAHTALERDFEKRKAHTQKDIAALENTLAIKRQERAQLEAPLTLQSKALEQREDILSERESVLTEEFRVCFEKEREAEKKLEEVQALADDLGDEKVRLQVKEKLLVGREAGLKDREMKHLLNTDAQEREGNRIAGLLMERENAVSLREQNVESKLENISQREKELEKTRLLVQSQRESLLLAQKEHGSSNRRSS